VTGSHGDYSVCSSFLSEPSSVMTVKKMHAESLPKVLLDQYLIQELPKHLQLPADDVHVLISTKSGSGGAEEYFANFLKPVLDQIGMIEGSYGVLKTESHESVGQFANHVLREKAGRGVSQTILLLSGDGGIVDLINGILRDVSPRTKYVYFNLMTSFTICFSSGKAELFLGYGSQLQNLSCLLSFL
jgi:hypothetical protein